MMMMFEMMMAVMVMIMTMMIDDYDDLDYDNLDNNCDGVARLQIIRWVSCWSNLSAGSE